MSWVERARERKKKISRKRETQRGRRASREDRGREEIEMEEREITELANMKIAWQWYARVT